MKDKRVTFLPRTCPECQKPIRMFKKYYGIYLIWKTEEPWKHEIAYRWDVCETCYKEYLKYYDSKRKEL